LGWDGGDRNISARVTGADPAEVAYTRDATNCIVRRDASAGDSTATVIYGYTGGGDGADVTLDASQRLLTRTVVLPGGVLYTHCGGTIPSTWDHPTVRGDLCLTTDQTGDQSGPLRSYTPFGDPLTPTGTVDPDADPDTQPGQSDYGWLGQHQPQHEHAGSLDLVQMGASLHSPLLGRFLTVDPVEAGSANDYVNDDPTNNTDLDGKAPRRYWRNSIRARLDTIGRQVFTGQLWLCAEWDRRRDRRYTHYRRRRHIQLLVCLTYCKKLFERRE
jgi:RHS repeat-associated protein